MPDAVTDTHALIWYLQDDARLSPIAAQYFDVLLVLTTIPKVLSSPPPKRLVVKTNKKMTVNMMGAASVCHLFAWWK